MFNLIIQWILQAEGGYVNNASDPGGETNFGISKRSYPDLDIKNMTRDQASAIYFRDYYDTSWEKLGFPLACCMMDTCVQSGRFRAQDTLSQATDYVDYLQRRLAFYKNLVTQKPALNQFYNGWMNRMAALRRFIDYHKDDQNVHS